MRRTVGKLAVNKANMMALSNQMTEQLGALGWAWSAREGVGRVAVPALWVPRVAEWPPWHLAHWACGASKRGAEGGTRAKVAVAGLHPPARSDDKGGGQPAEERRGDEARERADEGAAAAAHHDGAL